MASDGFNSFQLNRDVFPLPFLRIQIVTLSSSIARIVYIPRDEPFSILRNLPILDLCARSLNQKKGVSVSIQIRLCRNLWDGFRAKFAKIGLLGTVTTLLISELHFFFLCDRLIYVTKLSGGSLIRLMRDRSF